MDFNEVMHFIAQGAINISEGLTEIEADSPVHKAMQELCRMVNQGEIRCISPTPDPELSVRKVDEAVVVR